MVTWMAFTHTTNIRDKIVRTTTDNRSNFIRAFWVYRALDENNNQIPLEEARPSESAERENSEGEERTGEHWPSWVWTLLEEDDGLEYQLPKHHHCACHLLNLVSTIDSKTSYKWISHSTFSKCWSPLNKCGRSTTAAEIIELQLLRPNETWWIFLFLAMEKIVRIMSEQGEGAVTAVCGVLKILMLVAYILTPSMTCVHVRNTQKSYVTFLTLVTNEYICKGSCCSSGSHNTQNKTSQD